MWLAIVIRNSGGIEEAVVAEGYEEALEAADVLVERWMLTAPRKAREAIRTEGRYYNGQRGIRVLEVSRYLSRAAAGQPDTPAVADEREEEEILQAYDPELPERQGKSFRYLGEEAAAEQPDTPTKAEEREE